MVQASSPGLCFILMGPLVLLQVGNTTLIVFVSYFGIRVHRPRLIGCGAILVALAGLLMTLPHFISEPYRYDGTSSGKSRSDWAGGGHEKWHYCEQGPLPRPASALPPRTHAAPPTASPLPPSVPAWVGPSSSAEEWGNGESWGEALWANLGEGLLLRHCFFGGGGEFTTQPTLGPGSNKSSGNICGITVSHTTTMPQTLF